FDGATTVDAPVGEFFGSGLGANPVRSLLFAVDAGAETTVRTWWPMPYRQQAVVSLVNPTSTAVPGVRAKITSAPDDRWTDELAPGGTAGYFTAVSRRGPTSPGHDVTIADLGGRGKFVGLSQTILGRGSDQAYLEGDE